MLGYSFLEFAEFAEASTNWGRQYIPTVEQIHIKVIPGMEGQWIEDKFTKCVVCRSRRKPLHVREVPKPTCLDCILWPRYCHNPQIKDLIREFKNCTSTNSRFKKQTYRYTIKRNNEKDLSTT